MLLTEAGALFDNHPRHKNKALLLDITIVNPCAGSNLGNAVRHVGKHLADAVERKKNKYRGSFPATYFLLPLAMSTCGDVGSDPDDFLYKKDRCRDRLNSVTPRESPSDRRYEDIILQCLPQEYNRIRQTHFEREDCNLEDIRRMMSKIYADNLARSNSDSSRGIAGRGVAMQATGRDLSKINCYYCNKFGHYKNDCANFKAAHHQNRRRRQRNHKQRGGHQPDQPKPGGQQQQRGGGLMWCSYHMTTTHNDADCRATPANGLNGNAHFAQVRRPSVPGICSCMPSSRSSPSDGYSTGRRHTPMIPNIWRKGQK